MLLVTLEVLGVTSLFCLFKLVLWLTRYCAHIFSTYSSTHSFISLYYALLFWMNCCTPGHFS